MKAFVSGALHVILTILFYLLLLVLGLSVFALFGRLIAPLEGVSQLWMVPGFFVLILIECGIVGAGIEIWENGGLCVLHIWNGCKCTTCGKVREEGHDWNGCKCRKCGHVRNEGHEWRMEEKEVVVWKCPHETWDCSYGCNGPCEKREIVQYHKCAICGATKEEETAEA